MIRTNKRYKSKSSSHVDVYISVIADNDKRYVLEWDLGKTDIKTTHIIILLTGIIFCMKKSFLLTKYFV